MNCYLLPIIDDIINQFGESIVYSKLDLAIGYYQPAIKLAHTYRTAF